ncbi:MAG: triose-phosphate isomerase [Candidatus Bipolaricaulota bacterium]|jgi:triosephosphate isomerase|nr:triose-phosphate isomerase [Candidatus Bipolaricaulota bacterium]
MARRRLIAANWKMNKTPEETEAFVRSFLPEAARQASLEVLLLPPFTSLDRAGRLLVGTGIALGAQDLHFEAAGAFTGEVSAAMLSACGCRYVLVGHSERRALLREDDALVNRKLRRAVASGLVPILCVGETLAERRGGETERRIAAQLAAALDGVESRDVRPLIIAYEPVWAIGTGEAASPAAAEEVMGRIRETVGSAHGKEAREGVRLLYGGSVTPQNIASFLDRPDIDGALVGGASLRPDALARIVAAASSERA